MIKRALFGLSPRQASFDVRGFPAASPAVRARLERVIRSFIEGYNLAWNEPSESRLVTRLKREFDAHHVGFAFEGAGMRFALSDLLRLGRGGRLARFTGGVAAGHDYICTVGAGFAVARIPWRSRVLDAYLTSLDPLVAWCVLDGYGFHEGFFRPRQYIEACASPPAFLPPYARALFDAGLGRAIWWVDGADANRIATTVARFPEERRPQLWCGLGTALAYAGGCDIDACTALTHAAGHDRVHLLSGVPLAARMRQKADNDSEWTESVCRVLLDQSGEQLGDLVQRTVRETLAELGDVPPDELRRVCYARVHRKLVSHVHDFSRIAGSAAPR